MVNQNHKVIILANDIMKQFKNDGKETHYTYGTFYSIQSRLGILKTTIKFEVAITILKESLELLKREYDINFSYTGMYYSITQRKEDSK